MNPTEEPKARPQFYQDKLDNLNRFACEDIAVIHGTATPGAWRLQDFITGQFSCVRYLLDILTRAAQGDIAALDGAHDKYYPEWTVEDFQGLLIEFAEGVIALGEDGYPKENLTLKDCRRIVARELF